MFSSVRDRPDTHDVAEIDDADLLLLSRSIERDRRRAEADQVRVLAEIQRRALHTVDGHRGIDGWGRGVQRWSNREARARASLVRLGQAAPEVIDGLSNGTLGVAQAHLLGAVHSLPRCGHLLLEFLPIFLGAASHVSYAEFERMVTHWRLRADHSGADPAAGASDRSATLSRNDNGFSFAAHGSSIDGAELAALLAKFEQIEWQRDWDETKAIHGALAAPSLMARTVQQRRYDAFMAMVTAAGSTPAGSTPNEPLVNLIIDHETFDETISELFRDDDPGHGPPTARPAGDPTRGRSQTTDGYYVSPADIVFAALRGQIRRVITDRRGIVLDLGRRSRLFTGANRQAVLLAATRCTHPGCLVAAAHCQADHLQPFSNGGLTNTSDGGPACGHHNRWRYTARATARLDEHGHWQTSRADGTNIAPPDSPDPPP